MKIVEKHAKMLFVVLSRVPFILHFSCCSLAIVSVHTPVSANIDTLTGAVATVSVYRDMFALSGDNVDQKTVSVLLQRKKIPGLTLTYFTARSNEVTYTFEWEKLYQII